MRPPKPVGAPPAALVLHKRQTLDANGCAHDIRENAQHLVAEMDRAMEDQVITMLEFRRVRAHAALGRLLAEEQCSILRWSWRSLMAIEALIDRYRRTAQEMKKAARQSGLQTPTQVTQ